MTSAFRKLALLCLFLPGLAFSQGVTPNIGLATPAPAATNWNVALNSNFNILDAFLSGNTTVPGFAISGKFLAPTAPSFSTAFPGQIGYDLTANNWHVNSSFVDSLVATVPATTTVITTDCAQWVVSGGSVSLGDFGAPCQPAIGFTPLKPANNLSDVTSISAAMNNLAADGILGLTVPTPASVTTPTFTQSICHGVINISGTVVNTATTVTAGSATCTGGQLGDGVALTPSVNIFGVAGFMPSTGGILALSYTFASGSLVINVENNTTSNYTIGTLSIYYAVTR